MRSLVVRFALMLAAAAVVPLLVYGGVSIYTLRDGTRTSVVDGNVGIAGQVGQQVRRYVTTNIQIFQALAADLEGTDLTRTQQDRILKNFVLRFPEFRELTLFDETRTPVVSSSVGRTRIEVPTGAATALLGVSMSPVFVDDDLLPTTFVTLRLDRDTRTRGWLVGEFSIEELWRMVQQIQIGESGVVLIVGSNFQLLAHGDPNELSMVARRDSFAEHPLVKALQAAPARSSIDLEYRRPGNGEDVLGVGVRIPELPWLVLVEQPSREAYAIAHIHERELIAAISLALLIMILVGSLGARSLIRPIVELTDATDAIAEGQLDRRVDIKSVAEISRLGAGFNRMADRLAALQEDVRKQERHAVFGKVAAGLVHDLSHPFKNIQNNCRLVLKMHDDAEYRELFRRTVEREFATIKRVFEDLRNIARPKNIERFPLDLNKLASDVVESMRLNAEVAGLTLDLQLASSDTHVSGDMFALGRVLRNLVMNAIEATPPSGHVVVSTETDDHQVRLRVSDTGCGIPAERLPTLFEDFQTTKRQGLGLGLASSKKIIDLLDGRIWAEARTPKGSSFVVELGRVGPPRRATG